MERALLKPKVVLLAGLSGLIMATGALTLAAPEAASAGTHGHCVAQVAHTKVSSTDHDAHGDAVAQAAHACGKSHHHHSSVVQSSTTDRDSHGDAVSTVAHTANTSTDHDGHGDAVSAVASTHGAGHNK